MKFLERQQRKFCDDFTELYLLHMDMKGLRKQYNLDSTKIRVIMQPPSRYKEQMDQNFLDTRFQNYQQLADREEMSKSYLMGKYLKWDEEEIQANVEGIQKDIKLGFKVEEDSGY